MRSTGKDFALEKVRVSFSVYIISNTFYYYSSEKENVIVELDGCSLASKYVFGKLKKKNVPSKYEKLKKPVERN